MTWLIEADKCPTRHGTHLISHAPLIIICAPDLYPGPVHLLLKNGDTPIQQLLIANDDYMNLLSGSSDVLK